MRQYALQRLGCRNWYQFRNAHPLSLGMSLRRRSIIPLDKPADPSEGPTRRLAQTSRSTAAAQLEAILFLSREPLSLRRLAKLLRIDDVGQLRETLTELNVMYDREGAAFRIEEVGGGFLLLTRKRFVTWLRRLHGMTIEVRLSQPAMETLAVIAYRQPVLRAEIESVRGVQSGEMVRQLIDRDLVRIVGRSEQLGRPMLYGTTHRFLEVFGLGRIEELHQAKKDKKPLQKAAGMEREIVPIEHEATSPDELVENIENNPDIIQFPKTDQEDELMEELNQGQEQEQIEAEVEAGTDCDRDEDEWEEEEGEEEEWEEEDGDEDEEEWEEVEEEEDGDEDEEEWEEVEEEEDGDEDEEEWEEVEEEEDGDEDEEEWEEVEEEEDGDEDEEEWEEVEEEEDGDEDEEEWEEVEEDDEEDGEWEEDEDEEGEDEEGEWEEVDEDEEGEWEEDEDEEGEWEDEDEEEEDEDLQPL